MFSKQIEDFNENLLGLREFVDLTSSFLHEKHTHDKENFENIIRLAVYNGLLLNKGDDNVKDEIIQDKQKIETSLSQHFDFPLNLNADIIKLDKKSNDIEKDKGIQIRIKTDKKLSEQLEIISKRLNNPENHISLLYNNALISLLNSGRFIFTSYISVNYKQEIRER